MKVYKTISNPHSRSEQKSEAENNLLELFALLYRVDMRNKRDLNARSFGLGEGRRGVVDVAIVDDKIVGQKNGKGSYEP
ncbi:MAG: hypothetical protein WCW33_04230 [Candidatus Babeliales bacterium]